MTEKDPADVCPDCGADWPAEERVCPGCGLTIEEVAVRLAEQG